MAKAAANRLRTPRACERCRQARRRCEPPYPCQRCVSAGVSCDVRVKARPQRNRLRPEEGHRQHVRDSDSDGASARSDSSSSLLDVDTDVQHNPDAQLGSPWRSIGHEGIQSDTFASLRTLVKDVLLERYGYVLNCTLQEPSSSESKTDTLVPPRPHSALPLSSASTMTLLREFQKFMGWHDAHLVDIDELHEASSTLLENMSSISPNAAVKKVARRGSSLDSAALVFVALAHGAVAAGKSSHGRYYFDVSVEATKHFVERPTLDLCLAFFLQHVFALRIGTLNYTQSLIMQAIQSANDIKLHDSGHGIRGQQLYLLIYMADQYSSFTHSSIPIIKASKLPDDVFASLKEARPKLRTLIDLVMINGYIIEHTHGLQKPSQDDILALECRISSMCSKATAAMPAQTSCGGFRSAYEPLARIHMLCCRLKLRAPGLVEQTSWLPSLCICTHAALEILSTYFQLYRPILEVLMQYNRAQGKNADEKTLSDTNKLAATWRQVKRIVMSAFVITYAYLHGEMMHEEASRAIAMARLLLEYPQWRWGEDLEEAVQSLEDICRLSKIDLDSHMEKLLPPAGTHSDQEASRTDRGAAHAREPERGAPDSDGTYGEANPASIALPNIFDTSSVDPFFGADISTIQDDAFFNLWDMT